ncbi:MAG: FRG domain-containing protein [Verrucomicrobiales bacterium]|nr:FRG domain-containing protein [Verrucomicrobiales bacterium]
MNEPRFHERIPEVRATGASEFLERLRILHPDWRGKRSADWAFRGQGDARWPIVAKAFRKETDLSYSGPAVHPPLPRQAQFEHELRVLNHFLFTADRVGLPIPGDNQQLRLPFALIGQPKPQDWPWPTILEVLAIAQHHGVPTRLVDFSHNASVAAFFAAESAAKLEMSDPRPPGERWMAVWAVDLDAVKEGVRAHQSRGERPSVMWVTASRAANTFLHQQDALFLLDLRADERPVSPPRLEDAILAIPEAARIPAPGLPPILRVLLPTSEAMAVLRLLWAEFYHPARLMPTYDTVAKLADYRRWLGV